MGTREDSNEIDLSQFTFGEEAAAPTPAPGLIEPEQAAVQEDPLAGYTVSNLEAKEPKLKFKDRLSLSFIRDDALRSKYLESKGMNPEQFDVQDDSEGIAGIALADIADAADFVLSSMAASLGEQAGGIIGAGVGSTIPVAGTLAGFQTGKMVGAVGASAMYDQMRTELVQKVFNDPSINDSELAFETSASLLGSVFTTPGELDQFITRGATDLANPKTIEKLSKAASKAAEPVVNKVASFLGMFYGHAPEFAKQMLKNPKKVLRVSRSGRESRSILQAMDSDAARIGKQVNTQYESQLNSIKPRLKSLEIPAKVPRVDEASKSLQAVPAEFVVKFLDDIEIGNGTLDAIKSSDITSAYNGVAGSSLNRAFSIVKKDNLTFNDLETLRGIRNNLAASKPLEDVPNALRIMNNLMENVGDSVVDPKHSDALLEFKALNSQFASDYSKISQIKKELSTGTNKPFSEAGEQTIKQATGKNSNELERITRFRQSVKELQGKYDPDNKFLEKFDLIGASKLYKDSINKGGVRAATTSTFGAGAVVGTLTGAFTADPRAASLGAGLSGLGAGAATLASEAPGLAARGLAAGQSAIGLGVSSPARQAASRFTLEGVRSNLGEEADNMRNK